MPFIARCKRLWKKERRLTTQTRQTKNMRHRTRRRKTKWKALYSLCFDFLLVTPWKFARVHDACVAVTFIALFLHVLVASIFWCVVGYFRDTIVWKKAICGELQENTFLICFFSYSVVFWFVGWFALWLCFLLCCCCCCSSCSCCWCSWFWELCSCCFGTVVFAICIAVLFSWCGGYLQRLCFMQHMICCRVSDIILVCRLLCFVSFVVRRRGVVFVSVVVVERRGKCLINDQQEKVDNLLTEFQWTCGPPIDWPKNARNCRNVKHMKLFWGNKINISAVGSIFPPLKC